MSSGQIAPLRADTVPQINRNAYSIVYVVEVGLREFIRCALEKQHGSSWHRKCLSPSAAAKYKEGIGYERKKRWVERLIYHPVYYLDFPDLREILVRGDNWTQVFQAVLKDKAMIETTLTEIEPIRNRVAHNRRCPETDLPILVSAFQKLKNLLGGIDLEGLAAHVTTAPDVRTILVRILEETRSCFKQCLDLATVDIPVSWNATKAEWWFDQEFLGRPVASVQEFFEAIEHYQALPRARGTGHILEKFVKDSRLSDKHSAATETLELLIEES